jgi:hypothetical protein
VNRPTVFVTSKFLKSIGYDVATQVLEVELQDGRIYQYAGVTQAEYDLLIAAPSAGSHFLKQVKPNHPCTRIEEVTHGN